MNDKKIHIKVRNHRNSQGVIKVTPRALELLIDASYESGWSVRAIASEIIVQAIERNLIDYDQGEDVDVCQR